MIPNEIDDLINNRKVDYKKKKNNQSLPHNLNGRK